MGEALADGAVSPAVKSSRLDNILNTILGLVATAVLVLAGYFAYSVYQVRLEEANATPALRLVTEIQAQVRANPNDVILRVRLGEALGAAGKYDQAAEQFKNALKIEPNHTGAYLDLGIVAMSQNDPSAAERYFLKVIELTEGADYAEVNNRRESALFNLGLIALQQSKYEDAVGYFKGALRIRKDASDTYLNLAKAYEGLEEDDAAMSQLEVALTFDPNYAQAHFMMGEIYLKQNDIVNASYHLQRAVELAPDADPALEAYTALGTPEEHIAKGREALAAGDAETALTEALVATNLDPKSIDAQLYHAEVLVSRKAYKDAIDVYGKVLKLDPTNAKAKAEIARLKALAGS